MLYWRQEVKTMDMMEYFIVTALGAITGAYSAYRLAERRINRKEQEEYLALLLIIHEHLEYLQNWLNGYENQDGVAVITAPLVPPSITAEQVQRLMTVANDKDMPQTLIHILYFWRKAYLGIQSGAAFCLPIEDFVPIMDRLKYELLSLRTQYEQERGNAKHFPKLDGGEP